jgi:hypothetical protein
MGLRNNVIRATEVLRGREDRSKMPLVKRGSEALYSSGPGTDPDDHLWEPLSVRGGMRRTRNLPAITQRQMLDYAHHFYKSNPLAKRIIEIVAEYVIEDGITYVAEDPEVQRILDAHWTNPTNNWSLGQFERVRDLGLTGELCIPAHINKVNGAVTLGYIDPALIEYVIDDKDNATKSVAIVLRKLRGETERRAYKIIDIANVGQDEPAFGRLVGLPETEEEKVKFGFDFMKGDTVVPANFAMNSQLKVKWAGSVFFFTVNKVLSASRGWSDLLAAFDWIDAHDQYLFSTVEKATESAKYVKDVEIKGANQARLNEWLAEQKPLKPGEYFVHNENIKQQIMTPDLRLEDAAALASSLKNHTLASIGLPPIWFSEGSVSRASAPEMTEPTFKHIRMRQRYAADMLSTIFRFNIDQSILHGRLRQDKRRGARSSAEVESAAFYLRMPSVSAKDERALAIALTHISKALATAVGAEFLKKEEAERVLQQYLDMSGLDAWRDEPKMVKGVDHTPDDQFDPSSMFLRISEGIKRTERYTYYLSVDLGLDNLTRAATEAAERKSKAKLVKLAAESTNGNKEEVADVLATEKELS